MGKKDNETEEERARRLSYNREWNKKNKVEESKKRKERYSLWQKDVQINQYKIERLKVLQRMGGKCVFCGELDESVLSIDHILNDGAEERRKLKNIYFRLRFSDKIPLDRYQILCLSCNHKKRIYGDDTSKWPEPRTVQDQLDFIKSSLVTMEEARKIIKNG